MYSIDPGPVIVALALVFGLPTLVIIGFAITRAASGDARVWWTLLVGLFLAFAVVALEALWIGAVILGASVFLSGKIGETGFAIVAIFGFLPSPSWASSSEFG